MSSTRGVLWEIARPWVAWPLYSPRRLGATLAGVAVVLYAFASLHGGGSRQADESAVTLSRPVAATTAPQLPAAIVPIASVANAPGPVAVGFVRTWGAAPTSLTPVWLSAVTAYGVPGIADAVARSTPSDLAVSSVGDDVRVSVSGSAATVAVPTDSGTVTVSEVLGADRLWRVSGLAR